MVDLTQASALVTGGAGGFGSATARRLAQAGAKVVIADVADERGEALAKELGNGSIYMRTDIMDEASIERAVEAAVNLGPLRAAVVVHGGPRAPGSTGPRSAGVSRSPGVGGGGPPGPDRSPQRCWRSRAQRSRISRFKSSSFFSCAGSSVLPWLK